MQIQTSATTVTARALLQRINRKLAKEDERLCRGRSFYDHGYGQVFDHNLGEYYRVGTAGPYSNAVTETHVDLVELARELGVMHPSEKLAE